ncbi:MAG TPA: hypothetical protein VK585_05435, partial [Jiangellaceae bacterium]|nr:hypothetical protein [Jiangellaceae bacterium]
MRPAVRLRLAGGPHSARIVVLVPVEGKQADAGAAVLAAVRLAVSDAGLTIPDWTVEVAGVDGGADAGTAAEVAAELASGEECGRGGRRPVGPGGPRRPARPGWGLDPVRLTRRRRARAHAGGRPGVAAAAVRV